VSRRPHDPSSPAQPPNRPARSPPQSLRFLGLDGCIRVEDIPLLARLGQGLRQLMLSPGGAGSVEAAARLDAETLARCSPSLQARRASGARPKHPI
jgi:hypothetical protein